MICENCKIDRLVSDFINNHKICYRCVYQKKTAKQPKKRIFKPYFCRICAKQVIRDESLKKRQRSVFCSPTCALQGHKIMIKDHWTRKVRSGRVT
jgi:hypothetical protein